MITHTYFKLKGGHALPRSVFAKNLHITTTKSKGQVKTIKNFTLNFGPQHPAAHGILRLSILMTGEVIQRLDPQFGLLHRGTEKLIETRNLLQALPYFDRFDYVANLFQEHAFCLAVERAHLSNQPITAAVNLTRTLFDELSRVANHLLTTAAINMDMGAMGPMFWAFEEREQLMEFFERVSGARMHTAFYRPFGLDFSPLTAVFFRDVARFLNRSARSLSGAFLGLLNNRALKTRFSYIGQISPQRISNYGITGLIARSAGVAIDFRLTQIHSYGAYSNVSLRTFLGRRGDNWDRFLLRVKETVEAFRIVTQVLQHLTQKTEKLTLKPARAFFSLTKVNVGQNFKQPSFTTSKFVVSVLHLKGFSSLTKVGSTRLGTSSTTWFLENSPLHGKGRFSGMEELISHFRTFSEGLPTGPALSYGEVESPKGCVGVFLITDGSSRPSRTKLRTPVAHNMNLIPVIANGALFADFVATFCSLDIVLGEIDR